MSISGLSLIFLFTLSLLVGGGIVLISAWLGRGVKKEEKLIPYECGLDPLGSSRTSIPVKFFLVAIIFVIFDVGVAFLFPWAMIFREFSDAGEGIMAFIAGAFFLGILAVGLIYVWGKGALEWEK